MTQKAGAAEEKIENLDFIKIKNFCASKDIIKKMQRQPRKWEKIFANRLFDKGLYSRISHVAGRFFTSWATREAQEYWSG